MTKEKADASIRAAWICGIVSTAITLIFTLIGLFRGGLDFSGINYSLFTVIDVLLMTGFTVGIAFKSRVCAVLMLAYFIFCKYVQWNAGVGAFPIIIGLVFLYFYAQGARGVFVHHTLKKKETNPSEFLPIPLNASALGRDMKIPQNKLPDDLLQRINEAVAAQCLEKEANSQPIVREEKITPKEKCADNSNTNTIQECSKNNMTTKKKILCIISAVWLMIYIAYAINRNFFEPDEMLFGLIVYFIIPQLFVWGTVWVCQPSRQTEAKPNYSQDSAPISEKNLKRYSRLTGAGWFLAVPYTFSFLGPDKYSLNSQEFEFLLPTFLGAALIPITALAAGVSSFIKIRSISSLFLLVYATIEILVIGYRVFI